MGAKRILVTSGKGGQGKTTLALEVAVFMENKGHKVHIIDLDPQMGVANRLSGIEFPFTHITTSSIIENKNQVESMINEICDANDIVVFDSGPNRDIADAMSNFVAESLDKADLVLVPFSSNRLSMMATMPDMRSFSAREDRDKVIFVPTIFKRTKIEKSWLDLFRVHLQDAGLKSTDPLKDLVMWPEAESSQQRSVLEFIENHKDYGKHAEDVRSVLESIERQIQ